MIIVDHDHPLYRRKHIQAGRNKWNGAYYYSKEIVNNIIPLVKTDRNWLTINVPGVGYDHSIVFIHNNLHPELYDWLQNYKDLILVCGVPETCVKMGHLGTPIYLPLSIDVEQVKQYRCEKTQEVAFIGRYPKREGITFPEDTHIIENLPRAEILKRMAAYKKVYAVGRTAIEAKVLDCEILPYDPRFPDPKRWKVLDNKDAAVILQKQLNLIDMGGKQYEESICRNYCQDYLSGTGTDQSDPDSNRSQHHSY